MATKFSPFPFASGHASEASGSEQKPIDSNQQNMKIKPSNPSAPHLLNFCAVFPDGSLQDFTIAPADPIMVGGGDEYFLRNEIVPRIIACVNACQCMEDPEATIALVRERAGNAFDALGDFIKRYDDDFSLVARSEEIDSARVELSDLLGSLPHPDEPITLLPSEAESTVRMLDMLASMAGGDAGLPEDEKRRLAKIVARLKP